MRGRTIMVGLAALMLLPLCACAAESRAISTVDNSDSFAEYVSAEGRRVENTTVPIIPMGKAESGADNMRNTSGTVRLELIPKNKENSHE